MAHSRWWLWGLVGLWLGAGVARAQDGEEDVKPSEEPQASAPARPGPPWRDVALWDRPDAWMRQALWAGPWDAAVMESVADFVVPYPVPQVSMFLAVPDAVLYGEPTLASGEVRRLRRYDAVAVLSSAPWLPEGFAAVFEYGRVTGFVRREVLTERRPAVVVLLAESREQLARLDVDRARALAEAAAFLYPDFEAAQAFVEALDVGDGVWRPPEYAAPPEALPRPGAHVTPGATVYVGTPTLPLTERRGLSEGAQEMLSIHTPLLVLDVNGGWARVRKMLPPSRLGILGRDGTLQWKVKPPEDGYDAQSAEEGLARGFVLAHYLEAAPVDMEALRERARGLLRAGARAEALELLAQVAAAEPWNTEVRQEVLGLALALDRVDVATRAAWELAELRKQRAGMEAAAQEASGALELAVKLRFGCRGDLARAKEVEAGDSELETGSVPADGCLSHVDVEPPEPPPVYTHCDATPESELSEEDRERRDGLDAQQREARAKYDAELRPAFEQKLKHLRGLFPDGPYFCVTLHNTSDRTRVDVRVQYSARPVSKVETCEGEQKVEAAGVSALRVSELVVPYLEADAEAEVCIEVSRYEDMEYAAMLAPEVKAADALARKLALSRDEALAQGSTDSEEVQALLAQVPRAEASVEVPVACGHVCY